jgi:hypothetical protein
MHEIMIMYTKPHFSIHDKLNIYTKPHFPIHDQTGNTIF